MTTTFATRVKAAAKLVPAKHLFGGKAFISHVWAMGNFGHEMSLEAFKVALWAACNARELDLARSDMNHAMDAHDVRRSEMNAMGCKFHFVRL